MLRIHRASSCLAINYLPLKGRRWWRRWWRGGGRAPRLIHFPCSKQISRGRRYFTGAGIAAEAGLAGGGSLFCRGPPGAGYGHDPPPSSSSTSSSAFVLGMRDAGVPSGPGRVSLRCCGAVCASLVSCYTHQCHRLGNTNTKKLKK